MSTEIFQCALRKIKNGSLRSSGEIEKFYQIAGAWKQNGIADGEVAHRMEKIEKFSVGAGGEAEDLRKADWLPAAGNIRPVGPDADREGRAREKAIADRFKEDNSGHGAGISSEELAALSEKNLHIRMIDLAIPSDDREARKGKVELLNWTETYQRDVLGKPKFGRPGRGN